MQTSKRSLLHGIVTYVLKGGCKWVTQGVLYLKNVFLGGVWDKWTESSFISEGFAQEANETSYEE